MDSKLKAVTITSVIVMMILIIGSVVGIHVLKQMQKTEKSVALESASEENQEAVDTSAFMQDETFFDKDTTKYEQMKENAGKKLSLLATSVEKDMRIQVVNDQGALAAGNDLYITLNGKDEYKDLDRDGVIYIADLKAGEYQVALNDVKGYKVPAGSLAVRVKEKVEYIPIDDISLLIKTEADINAGAEDTGKNGAEDDADSSEIKDIRPSEESKKFGIDVSKWNKEINWEKVRAAGVDFAIIRCGYRGSVTGTLVEDPYFYKNIEEARKAGVKVGLYFFSQAVTPVEAVEEASMVLCLEESGVLDYPVFIDSEGAGGNGRADGLDVETRTQVVSAFCETIKNAGYQAGVYASRNWLNDRLDASRLDDYVVWLAQYRETPDYEGKYQMWQYTSNGSIDGIEGRVDFNEGYLEQ